jgi:hypothetical protein
MAFQGHDFQVFQSRELIARKAQKLARMLHDTPWESYATRKQLEPEITKLRKEIENERKTLATLTGESK